MGFLDSGGLSYLCSKIKSLLDNKLDSTTKYAVSNTVGGAATSANKLNTNAGSTTQPVYFENGIPVETKYTVGKSVPSNAIFTDTTYSDFVKSGSGAKAGLVPAPSTTEGATKYLREDGTWSSPMIVGTETPTTDTCPVGCWYGVYEE